MSRVRLLILSVVAGLAGVVLVAAPAQASTVTLGGAVRTDGGNPISGLVVTLGYPDGSESTQTTTAADGTYSFQVEQGRDVRLILLGDYAGHNLTALTKAFSMASDRTENLKVPVIVPIHVNVSEYDGQPSTAALVTTEAPSATTGTSGGLTLTSYIDGSACYTNATGVCDVTGLRGGTIGGISITGRGRAAQTFASFTTPFEISKFYSLARAHPITGLVTTSDGAPLAGATVRLGSTISTTTASDGSYEIWSTPGSRSLDVVGDIEQGGWTVPYEIVTTSFTLDRARRLDVVLPRLLTLHLHVQDSVGQPIPGAGVEMTGPASVVTTQIGGIPATGYLLRRGGPELSCQQVDDAGVCDFPVFMGGNSGSFTVTTPTGFGRFFDGVPAQPGPVRESIARLARYATAPSAGSSTGRVFARLLDGDDIVGLGVSAVETPSGYEALVGRLDYRVRAFAPGGSSELEVQLPPGAEPNALMRVDRDGHLTAVASGLPPSGTFKVVVVDGSAADSDGTADGFVTANVIPVIKEWLRFDTDDLPGAAKGKSYQFQLAGSGPGEPFTWSIVNGALPPGLTMSPAGVISGTPTELGGSDFTVRITDRFGFSATHSYFLFVSTIAVTTRAVPDAYVGAAYSATMQSTGGPFPSWKLAGGALPPGLKLSSGKISGTPTTPGSFTFWVTVTSNGVTSYPPQRLTLLVHPMEVANATLPQVVVGTSYSQKLTTLGGKSTVTWAITNGVLPPGLTLSSTGTISGNPTAVGSWTVTVRATDASTPAQTAERTLVLVVTPMQVATTTLKNATKSWAYSATLATVGGIGTLTWSVTDGTLPPGIKLSTAGKLTGTPTTRGTWTFTVKVADSGSPRNEATATLSLTVT